MTLPQLLRIRWAVRATLLLGVAASVVANVLHAVDNPISQAIAAWPPFALLLTVELISRVPVHRRSLAFVRWVATAAIAGIAAWISYWHMAGVAAKYGETGASAYLLPISVDGLIVVASICLIELGGRITEAQAAKRAAAGAAASAPAGNSAADVPARPRGAARFDAEDELRDEAPGIAALVPRPLTVPDTGAYPQLVNADEDAGEYGLAAGRRPGAGRTTAERTAAAGAIAVAAAERRDQDPLTTTGSQPAITSDVAAAVEAALSGRQVNRGVRGGANPRNRGAISVASGPRGTRPAAPDEEPRLPADAPGGDGRQAAPAARTSAATSATRRTTTGRVTAVARPAAERADAVPGEQPGAGTRPRRSAAETAALAAEIEASNPGISEAAVADQLGITTRRLRDVRRSTDTLPA